MVLNDLDLEDTPMLILILDVKSSTHQMLHKSCSHLKLVAHVLYITGHALDYKGAINSFVTWNRDLHDYELTDYDWEAVVMITYWLKSFHTATTQMLKTKSPMLSTTHAIFHGL